MEDVQRHKKERDKQLDRVIKAVEKNPELVVQLDDKGSGYFHRYFLKESILDNMHDAFMNINLTADTSEKNLRTTLSDSVYQNLQVILKKTSDSLQSKRLIAPMVRSKEDSVKAMAVAIRADSVAGLKGFSLQQMSTALNSTNNYQRLMDQLMVEVNKKYSIPVACIVFVMLGAPIGVRARKGNLGIAGGISLFFFIAYYFCLILGENFADRQLLNPFVAMWFMNVFLGVLGLVLIYQTSSEKDLGIIAFLRNLSGKIVSLVAKSFHRNKH